MFTVTTPEMWQEKIGESAWNYLILTIDTWEKKDTTAPLLAAVLANAVRVGFRPPELAPAVDPSDTKGASMFTTTITLPNDEKESDDIACHAWLAAVLATPVGVDTAGMTCRGSAPLWAKLLSTALSLGWPREGTVETRDNFYGMLDAAAKLATAAGAPATPEYEPNAYTYKTVTGTEIRIGFPSGFLPAVITITSPSQESVYRRALGAAATIESLTPPKYEAPEEEPEPEIVRRYGAITWNTTDMWVEADEDELVENILEALPNGYEVHPDDWECGLERDPVDGHNRVRYSLTRY